jgi:isoquinoline 1-oxidoreductase alpha subunit
MISVTINGVDHELDVPADMPLVWVLRDVVGLTGTKFGCGIAQCGACTVHVDGEATLSCVTPVSSVGGRHVTTIEGLSSDIGARLRQAWTAEQVVQCGYCQSGQLMTAADLIAKNPRPSDGVIAEAMNRVICRCGTYERIRAAIHRAVSDGGHNAA